MPSGDVLILIDGEGRVVEWRRAAEELFGCSAEQAVGRLVSAIIREGAADGAGRPKRFSDAAAVLVKPVLRGTEVMWEARMSSGPVPEQDAAILTTLFTHSPTGLHVLDTHLRVVRTSTPGLHGTPAGHLLGMHFTQAYDLEDPEKETAVAQRVLDGGEPVVNRLVRSARTPGGPMRRIHSISYVRLEDSRGEVLGVVASTLDVTDRENARGRLDLLNSVRTRVRHGPNVAAVCQELADAVVPAFAGIAVVEVIDDVVRGEEPPQIPVHVDVPLRRAAFHGGIPPHPMADVRPPPNGTPFASVLSNLRPRLVTIPADDTPWPAADPARADVIERSGAHSLIVVPLALRDRGLGVASFYRVHDQDPFEEEDIKVASSVCAHAALCIEDARRYMREWITAATVQRRLLPQQPVAQTTVETCRLHLPNPEGGGTWSDAIALPGARTALIVGDVAGHGIAAALTMGFLRTALHTLAAQDLQPDELLARLNDTADRLAAARAGLPPDDPLHSEQFTAGCTIVIYDPVELTCAIARAGLPEPVAVFPDGSSVVLPVPPGPPLAGRGNASFPATTIDIPEGSTLALGTAGLARQVLTPSAPLHTVLGGAGTRPLSGLRDAVARVLTGTPRTGEALMLFARTTALAGDHVLTHPLPAHPEAASIARNAARSRLQAWDMDEDTTFTTELIVSELVGNAIRYGAPPLQLRLIHDRMLTCEVTDSATSAPHVRHARTVDEGGRGLFIVSSLTDQWGTRYHPRGKTIWAEQPTGCGTRSS
ncbi:SpoIIE family protein phosphatase [Streptomyces chiangmaiensis]|uniref:SpoIIE family protein phosphatase n=1 Tax=Streptomyces chiangmaiensis TaxID=766497 RepID=A0ABU7FQH6_9ACTN|nr:SpoIIE family protein phosphatase [Streptomyces chiangmaiensis]MED7826195.1 SpoIIE family protein phosphatase [Streptomyces chiangmaiensis]